MTKPMAIDPFINDIIERYYDMVFKLAFARTRNHYDAEDVLQEVFLRYIRRKPEFENTDHEKAWFLKVTVNCSKNLFASLAKTTSISLDLNYDGVSDEERILDEFLAKLPAKYRTAIHLFYYEDLKIVEIAKLLDIKESTIKMQLTRARRLLRDYMEVEND